MRFKATLGNYITDGNGDKYDGTTDSRSRSVHEVYKPDQSITVAQAVKYLTCIRGSVGRQVSECPEYFPGFIQYPYVNVVTLKYLKLGRVISNSTFTIIPSLDAI